MARRKYRFENNHISHEKKYYFRYQLSQSKQNISESKTKPHGVFLSWPYWQPNITHPDTQTQEQINTRSHTRK